MSAVCLITPQEADKSIEAARNLAYSAADLSSITSGGLATRSHWIGKARKILAETETLIRREIRRASR